MEIKTEITDPASLVVQVDRYRRLAVAIVRDRGWIPESVSVWVVVADSSMNRRRLTRHRTMLRNRFPLEGRTMRSWPRDPSGAVAALSFLANDQLAERWTVGTAGGTSWWPSRASFGRENHGIRSCR